MAQDYRYQKPEESPQPTNEDVRAIIKAINSGWIARGFAMAFGFFLFGAIFCTVVFLVREFLN